MTFIEIFSTKLFWEIWKFYNNKTGNPESSYGETGVCGPNTRCITECQGRQCECLEGFIPNSDGSLGCEPIDPCQNKICGDNKECKKGTCYCIEGWYPDLNSGNCLAKVDECLLDEHDCGEYSKCVDNLQAFSCECNDAYVDISEQQDGSECVHSYETDFGLCNLKDYSARDLNFLKWFRKLQ